MNKKVYELSEMAILLALALALGILENWLPLPINLPGVKLGLANIVVMFALLKLNRQKALMIVIAKSGFSLVTRGLIAGLLSFSGGIFALLAMISVQKFLQGSLLLISIAGALAFNFGQLLVIIFIYGSVNLAYYGFVLAVSAIITATITALILRGLWSFFKEP